MKLKERIEALERKVKELEARPPMLIPYPVYQPYQIYPIYPSPYQPYPYQPSVPYWIASTSQSLTSTSKISYTS